MKTPRTVTVLLALGTALLSSLLFTTPAAAAPYASWGAVGGTAIGHASCNYMRSNASAWIRIITPPPTIYAGDRRPGGGNDAAHVRYRAFVVDANNGAVLDQTAYSPVMLARDNQRAPFTQNLQFNLSWRGNYVVDYRVEWLDGTRVVGWKAHRIDSYHFYNQRIGPIGPFSTCYFPRR